MTAAYSVRSTFGCLPLLLRSNLSHFELHPGLQNRSKQLNKYDIIVRLQI
jgi:hypothetical protein